MPLPPSAADWTRVQKLKRAFNYGTPGAAGAIDLVGNTDLYNRETPAGCNPCSSRPGIRRDQDRAVGSSKTRREASKWIDYKAAAQLDFVTAREHTRSKNTEHIRTQLCGQGVQCATSVLRTKPGILKSAVYQHSRIL
jgi:hypothetical protein